MTGNRWAFGRLGAARRKLQKAGLSRILLLAAGLLLPVQAQATEAGWRQITVAGTADSPPIPVALYFPTQGTARAVAMGPFTVRVAFGTAPDQHIKALILLSHGTGGSELGHSSLAEALARDGYLVASLRHPGDNWQDRSLLQASGGRYFAERPRQASQVINALLRDPEWKDRIASDAQGPRVGAVGHSAGGYTVLALAGGQPDLARLAAHCDSERADDPIFCSMGRPRQASDGAPPPAPVLPPLTDSRVRAVVALAPMGVVFTAQSLAAVKIPTAIYQADLDRFLVPRFHAEWVARNLPGTVYRRIPNAWHFAFMDSPGMPIQTEDGDVRADPPGFDRPAFLAQLDRDVPGFFDKVFSP
jgi:predicted dienelactone hydrolase